MGSLTRTLTLPALGFFLAVLETVRARNYSFCSVIMNAPAAIMALKLEKGNKVQEKLVVSQSLGEKKLWSDHT